MTDQTSLPPRGSDRAALVVLVLSVVGFLAVAIAATFIGMSWWDGVRTPPATTGAVTTGPATTGPVTTGPVTTAPAPATTVTAGTPATTVPDPGEFALTPIVDDTGTLEVSVPDAWFDVGTGQWTRDGVAVGASLSAAPDLEAWVETWGVPGIFVGATSLLSLPEALGDFSTVCFLEEAGPITLSGAIGVVERWSDCGEEASDFLVAVADIDGTVLLVQVVTVAGDPVGLADAVVNTLRYVP